MTSTIPSTSEEFMDFWYSNVEWKEVLKADKAETICVPPCHDVLKNSKRDDIDEAPNLKRYIAGQKGEAEFLRKFIDLNMGGILVSGLETFDLEASKTIPKKVFEQGEWDAIFFHQNRGIFVIEVKATETNDVNTVNERIKKAKTQLDKNIENIEKSFHKLYQSTYTNISGFICFPFRNEVRETYEGYRVIDRSAMNNRALFKNFFEPQASRATTEVHLLQPFAVEFVCCRSKVEFHSQAYNAMQVATWIMEQDITQQRNPTKIINVSGNGPSGKVILTAKQLEIVECREKCITVRGAPGSGKTLVLMLRALKAAMENKPGAVFVFVNEKLKAKYEHYFYEEKEKIVVDDVKNIDRTPNILTMDKKNLARPEDDVFFDETPVEESYIKYANGRASCEGSTTMVFTGLYKPGEAVASLRPYLLQLKDCKHFELMKVLRGTASIFDKWEQYFPHGITIGHSIGGIKVKTLILESFEEVQKEIARNIIALTNTNKANNGVASLSNKHIAVITCDEKDSIEMGEYFETIDILCGQVSEQARKSKNASIVAVDVYLNTPSYEWPIVFIILKPGYRKEEILPISASRCIASLFIIHYTSVQSHRSDSNMIHASGIYNLDNISITPSRKPSEAISTTTVAAPSTETQGERRLTNEEIVAKVKKLTEEEIKKLVFTRNLQYFCENLEALEVINLLQEQEIFRPPTVQKIKGVIGSYEQNTMLFHDLMKRPKEDLLNFFNILLRTNHKKLAEKLVERL